MRWLLLLIPLLTACSDRFRYPCQDPGNWDTPPCKRPMCAVTSQCPDQLTRPEDRKED
jgi:hypothetical protein